MAAQTQDTIRAVRSGELIEGVGVQASTRIFQGSIVEIDASGHLAPATKAAGKTYFGLAETGADNRSGAAAALDVKVRRRAVVLLAKTGTAVPGKMGYIADDQTVTDVPAAASKVGRIVATDDDGVWVDMADLF